MCFFGINNLFDCFNMCYEFLGVVLIDLIGIGKGLVIIGDVEYVDLIVIVG